METMFCLLQMPRNEHSHRPLGSHGELLTFCGLNNRSKGIFRDACVYSLTETRYSGGVHKQGRLRLLAGSFSFCSGLTMLCSVLFLPPPPPLLPSPPPAPSPTPGTVLDADSTPPPPSAMPLWPSLLFHGKQASTTLWFCFLPGVGDVLFLHGIFSFKRK